MKPCFVIKSHCNTQEKLDILLNLITHLRVYNYPILIHSSANIAIEYQKLVDFYIYYKNAQYAKSNVHIWFSYDKYPNIRFDRVVPDFGYPEFLQMRVSSNFLNSLGYDTAHIINYDTCFEDIISNDLINKYESYIRDGYELVFNESKDSYFGLVFYSINTKSISKLDFINENTWDLIYKKSEYVAEDCFYEISKYLKSISGTKHLVLNDYINNMIIHESHNFINECGVYMDSYKYKLLTNFNRPVDLISVTYFDGTIESYSLDENPFLYELKSKPIKILVSVDGNDYNLFNDNHFEIMEKEFFINYL